MYEASRSWAACLGAYLKCVPSKNRSTSPYSHTVLAKWLVLSWSALSCGLICQYQEGKSSKITFRCSVAEQLFGGKQLPLIAVRLQVRSSGPLEIRASTDITSCAEIQIVLAWDPHLSCGMIHMCYHLSALTVINALTGRKKNTFTAYSLPFWTWMADPTFLFLVGSTASSCHLFPVICRLCSSLPCWLSTITSDLPVRFLFSLFLPSRFFTLCLSLCTISLSPPSLGFISFHPFFVLWTSSILPAFTLGISPYILCLRVVCWGGLNCGEGASLTQPPSYSDACQGLRVCPPGRAEDVPGAGGDLYEQIGRGQHSCSNRVMQML